VNEDARTGDAGPPSGERNGPAPGANCYHVYRLLLCLATSLVVAATAYTCAWLKYRNVATLHESTEPTRADLETLRQAVEDYKATRGRLPERLTDLSVVREKKVRVLEGIPVDQWGWMIRYDVWNGTYRLYSHGKENKPGGLGDYADLHAGQPDPAAEPVTFSRFLTDPKAFLLQAACILGGVAAFPLCLLQTAPKGGERPTLGRIVLTNVVTAVFTTFAALVIGMLHIIPGGH
jgi:Type II secretion system (T2SS), protein G